MELVPVPLLVKLAEFGLNGLDVGHGRMAADGWANIRIAAYFGKNYELVAINGYDKR